VLHDRLSAVNTPVCLVQSGSEALAKLRAGAKRGNGFGVVVLDASLPDVNAAELGHCIKSAFATRVIVVASLNQDVEKLDRVGSAASQSPSASRHCGIASPGSAPKPKPAPPAQRQTAPNPVRRVLLVEDSRVNMEVGIAILESMGCAVEAAENGLRALDRHASGEYGVIFMDCQMPRNGRFRCDRGNSATRSSSRAAHSDNRVDRERSGRRS
jgi:two-component system, sensor histidine kinase and response regulator